MKNIADIYNLWNCPGRDASSGVLITLVSVTGSHYRHPGARLLIIDSDKSTGSVSAGCLESVLRGQADEISGSSRPVLKTFNTTPDETEPLIAGMGCGGIVELLIEPINSESVAAFMSNLGQCLGTRQSFAVAILVRLNGSLKSQIGMRMIAHPDGNIEAGNDNPSIVEIARNDLIQAFDSHKPVMKTYTFPEGDATFFIERISPPVSLVIFGAGEDSIPVFCLAQNLGWQVTVADHRPAYLTKERFVSASGLHVIDPEQIERSLSADNFDAAVVMTHSDMRDFAILSQLLPSRLKYIGLLGASKRGNRLIADIVKMHPEFDNERLDRLFAPVGLDLGAEGPEEIALSIISEIQMALSGAPGNHLRDKSSSTAQGARFRSAGQA